MTVTCQKNAKRYSCAADRILVALDTPELERAKTLVNMLDGHVGGVKIGLEFFNSNGPQGVQALTAGGIAYFLDLKFHDIPNTVSSAVRTVVPLAPLMLNVHALGGREMLRAANEAAREAADAAKATRPLVLAVTVLTSLDDTDLRATGQQNSAEEQALRLACLAQECALDGVVCSPAAITGIRKFCGPDFTLVVPGIRQTGATAHDQKAVATPAWAVTAGADYLVIGRAITEASDPVAAARRITADIESG